jgi:hypothetical protein
MTSGLLNSLLVPLNHFSEIVCNPDGRPFTPRKASNAESLLKWTKRTDLPCEICYSLKCMRIEFKKARTKKRDILVRQVSMNVCTIIVVHSFVGVQMSIADRETLPVCNAHLLQRLGGEFFFHLHRQRTGKASRKVSKVQAE